MWRVSRPFCRPLIKSFSRLPRQPGFHANPAITPPVYSVFPGFHATTRLPRQPGYHATCVFCLSRLSRHYPAFTPLPGFHATTRLSRRLHKVEDSLPRLQLVFLYLSTGGLFPPHQPLPTNGTRAGAHNYTAIPHASVYDQELGCCAYVRA